jgi:hypothetical protein
MYFDNIDTLRVLDRLMMQQRLLGQQQFANNNTDLRRDYNHLPMKR